MPFPEDFPMYPLKQQFVEYLEAYAKWFGIKPVFEQEVESARYDESLGLWRVKSVWLKGEEIEYVCRWLVVATGENAEAVVPEIKGIENFRGEIQHTAEYRSGSGFRGKKVLVVGCGIPEWKFLWIFAITMLILLLLLEMLLKKTNSMIGLAAMVKPMAAMVKTQ